MGVCGDEEGVDVSAGTLLEGGPEAALVLRAGHVGHAHPLDEAGLREVGEPDGGVLAAEQPDVRAVLAEGAAADPGLGHDGPLHLHALLCGVEPVDAGGRDEQHLICAAVEEALEIAWGVEEELDLARGGEGVESGAVGGAAVEVALVPVVANLALVQYAVAAQRCCYLALGLAL